MNQNLVKSFKIKSLKLRKYSPTILTCVGVVGTVASAVLACKATTKASQITDKLEGEIKTINSVYLENDIEKYDENDKKKDLTIVYGHAALDFVKLYGPSVALGIFSLGCMVGSNRILNKRNATLAAAYAGLNKTFKEYRGRVVERFGDNVDKELRYNVKAKEFKTKEKGKDGKTKTKKEKVDVIDPNAVSQFARFFDELCPGWQKDSEHNLYYLTCQQSYANDKLKANGYLFLNEVYEMLGFPKTKMGQFVGWVYDEDNPIGDNFVDFGIYEGNVEEKRDFVNGYEKSILLDFNVDGNILDLIIWKDSSGRDYWSLLEDNPGALSTFPCKCKE